MLKKVIEQRTGIPSELLTSETEKGTIEQARALLAYKKQCEKQCEDQREKTNSEQFSDWFKEYTGTEAEDDPAEKALAEVAEAYAESSRLYPSVPDGGEVDHRGIPDGKSPAEHFWDWFLDQTAWNPNKSEW